MIADDQRSGVDQVEARPDPADGQDQPVRLGELGVGENLAQAFDLGGVMTGDQDAVAGRRAVQLGLHLRQVAGEPLDALDPQVAGRFQGIRGERGEGDGGEADQSLEAGLDAEEPARILDPAEIVASFLAQVVRFQQGDPGSGREEIGRMAEMGRIGVLEPERGGEGHGVPSIERALGFGVERPDRFDLVAEELDPDGVGGIVGEDVEDAAADAELAGDLDDLGAGHPAIEQPAGQVLHWHRVADGHHPRHPGHGLRLRHGLEHRLERSDHQPGRLGTSQVPEHPQSAAEDLVGGIELARQLLPGGKDFRRDPGKGRHVVPEIVHIADMRQEDHQGRGGMQAQSGRGERRRRAPGTVNGRAAAVLERGQDFREPRRALDQPRQVLETADWRTGHGSCGALRHTCHLPLNSST